MTQQSRSKPLEVCNLSSAHRGEINAERSDCMVDARSCLCMSQVSIGQVTSGSKMLIWKGKKVPLSLSGECNKDALESVPSQQGCVKALPYLF